MPNKSWQMVHLDDVLGQVWRSVPVEPAIDYSILGAHWYAKGLYVKEVKSGTKIKASKLYRVERGDFVYNRLFAWKGAFAVATDDNDGCFVSNEFPCFKVNSDRIDVRYLWHYFSRQSSWNEALGLSYGATPTSRNRLNEKHFLSLEIPLPPLSEQRRIVEKIERLAARVEEASRLKASSTSCLILLNSSVYGHVFQVRKGWKIRAVSEFCENPQYGYTASASQENVGPHLLRITDIQDGKVNWQSVPFCVCSQADPYLLKENDILFARTGATTGKSFLIKDCPAAVFASYLIRLRVRDSVLPEYLYAFFQTQPIGSRLLMK